MIISKIFINFQLFLAYLFPDENINFFLIPKLIIYWQSIDSFLNRRIYIQYNVIHKRVQLIHIQWISPREFQKMGIRIPNLFLYHLSFCWWKFVLVKSFFREINIRERVWYIRNRIYLNFIRLIRVFIISFFNEFIYLSVQETQTNTIGL